MIILEKILNLLLENDQSKMNFLDKHNSKNICLKIEGTIEQSYECNR